LHKRYGDQTVLDGLDLTVPAGSVTALLGPNGAGKTTTVSILSTLLPADGGTARVLGHDVAREPQAVRLLIGVTGQLSAVDPLLTVSENLRLMADLFHLPRREGRRRAADLAERFGLAEAAGKRAQQLSGGMRRKLDLAMTLVGGPQVVFLDEPTTGLDPRARRDLWDQVRALVADGVSVLLTTQYLDEADQLADSVAVLHGGRLVAHDTPAGLKAAHDAGSLDDVFLALTDAALTASENDGMEVAR
jgi:ABC-2 type transport system ATP-binding protein